MSDSPKSVKEFFGDVWKTFLDIAGQTAASSAAKMPEVQKKLEEAKTAEAKNILWEIFPVVAIGVILFIAIKSFGK